MNTEATESHHTQLSSNPGIRATTRTLIANRTIRTPDAMSDGSVFPIAWNMLEATKISPDATKVSDMMRRYSAPISITAGSDEKAATSGPGMLQHKMLNATIA